jgi:antitoxin Phd
MKKSHLHKQKLSNTWQIQEAKAKFSQLIVDATQKGYQVITKQGEPVAILISKTDFDKITHPKGSLLEFFKTAPCQDVELDIERSKGFSRNST